MIIDQLPNLASLQATDEIPVERGTTTYKSTLQKVRDLLQTLITFPVTSVNGMTGAVDVYPVGSIYMSVNSTDPGTLFGGTWERLENRFLLGAGSNYTAGTTGGEAEHTLVKAELPAEQYRVGQDMSALGVQETWYLTYSNGPAPAQNAGAKIHSAAQGAWAYTEPLGSGQAHNNMPPYLTVYMWKRTA